MIEKMTTSLLDRVGPSRLRTIRAMNGRQFQATAKQNGHRRDSGARSFNLASMLTCKILDLSRLVACLPDQRRLPCLRWVLGF